MRKTEDIVCYYFQGWPEYKMNLREILLALGVSRMEISSNSRQMLH